MSKRFIWADLLRVLAIYLVIVVHTSIFPSSISSNVFPVFITFAIAKTGVPLFFMLSGALLLSKSESPKTFYTKRFTRLFFPWIFWTGIFFVFLLFYSSPSSLLDIVEYIKLSFRVYWFIPIIIILYLLTPTIRTFLKHAENREIYLLLLIWFFIVTFIPYFHNTLAFPMAVDNSILRQVVSFSGYFLLGYALFKFKFIKTTRIALAIFVTGLIWSVVGAYYTSIFSNSIQLYYLDYFSPSIVVLSVGIFTSIQMFGEKLNKKLSDSQKKSLAIISGSTLGIYLLHTLHIQILSRVDIGIINFNASNVIETYFISVLLFVVYFIIIYLLQKIKWLKKFIT